MVSSRLNSSGVYWSGVDGYRRLALWFRSYGGWIIGTNIVPHQRCDDESFGPPSPWQLSDLYCPTASFKTCKLLLWYPSISSNCNPQSCSCTYFYHTFWGNKLPSMWARDLQSYPRWLPCSTNQKGNDQFTLVGKIILEPSLLVLGLTVSIPFLFWRVRCLYLLVTLSFCGWWKLLKTPDWCKPE